MVDIFMGVGSFKLMLDAAKNLKNISDPDIRKDAVVALQEQIVAAQESYSALLESVRTLEAEARMLGIGCFSAWSELWWPNKLRSPAGSESLSLPHSGKSHFNVWQITPSTPKMGSGRSSISSSLPLPQHSQFGRLLRGDSFAAAACNSPRASIVVACRNILNRRTMDLVGMGGLTIGWRAARQES